MFGGVLFSCFVSYLTMLASVTNNISSYIYIYGWEKDHLSVRLMQGMQVGEALLLGLLKVVAEEAQGCHASQYILHHCLLPRCLQYHSECTGNVCILYITNEPTS